MNIQPIESKINKYKQKGLALFVTSSFQTHSIPLLHIISRIDNSIPIYFLNTGYHFPETLQFRDELAESLELNVVNLESPIPKHQQKDSNGRLMFASNPEYCCYMNKTLPLEPVLNERDVWISGVRADQNSNRSKMKFEERTPDGTLRYHPILDWTNRDIRDYRKEFNLPPHPLEAQGYLSIGCEPCTRPFFDEDGERSGRWTGMSKNECGLHTDLRSISE